MNRFKLSVLFVFGWVAVAGLAACAQGLELNAYAQKDEHNPCRISVTMFESSEGSFGKWHDYQATIDGCSFPDKNPTPSAMTGDEFLKAIEAGEVPASPVGPA